MIGRIPTAPAGFDSSRPRLAWPGDQHGPRPSLLGPLPLATGHPCATESQPLVPFSPERIPSRDPPDTQGRATFQSRLHYALPLRFLNATEEKNRQMDAPENAIDRSHELCTCERLLQRRRRRPSEALDLRRQRFRRRRLFGYWSLARFPFVFAHPR